MPNTPISGFTSGAPAQSGDEFVIARSGANFKLTNTNISSFVLGGPTTQLGAADAAAPVAQTFKVQSGTAGASATTVSISGTSLTIAGTVTGTIAIGHAVTGTGVSAGTLITAGSGTSWTVNNSQTVGPITAYFNSVGADFTIRGSQGSGPSAGGSIIFQVAPAGLAATTAQNAYAQRFSVGPTSASVAASTSTAALGVHLLHAGRIIVNNGAVNGSFDPATWKWPSTASIGFASTGDGNGSSLDTILTRAAAATLQLGAADAAAPVAQTLLIQSGSGTDINGVAFNIGGSKSTGTGTAGLVNIQTSSRGAASGTSQNVLATVASFGPNTLSGSQAISLLDMAQTWNTSGAPTAIKLNVTNTSSPINSFLIGLQNNGTNQFAVKADNGACFIGTPTSDLNNYTLLTLSNDFYINSKSVTAGGVRLCSGTYAWAYLKSVGVSGARFQLGKATPFGWTDNAEGAAGTFDTILTRDAANTLALRNSTAAQLFRVYSTYNGTNDAYGAIGAGVKLDGTYASGDENILYIGSQKKGSPTALTKLAIQVDGSTYLDYNITNGNAWTIAGGGGGGGVLYGTAILMTGGVTGATHNVTNAGTVRTRLESPASDGVLTLYNTGRTDWGRLQFGGTTSSFPALKRSSTTLQVRLADDSAFGSFQTGGFSGGAPTIKTANYTQLEADYSLIFNGTGSITLTLLAAATYPGKILYVKTIAAQTVVSASSNVKPIDTDTAGTAILAATAGKWAMLQSDGTDWVIMAQG